MLQLDGAVADAGASAKMTVEKMLAAMSHRGPDGRATWADREVVVGHLRLAVRDLGPAAAQPSVAAGGAGVLVYNGEVYNDAELRRELEAEGATFRGTGDAEVVREALARWGPAKAVRRFDGMFAFAWWDARERRLWLARDRFGIKPLHVAVRPDRFLFASEIRALRTFPGVGEKPDVVEILRRLVPWRVDDSKPPFEGVETVPAGGLWKVGPSGIERGLWFDLIEEVDVTRILAAEKEDPSAWVERVEKTLSDAVRSHLVSDVKLATFLSGGVDSGLVTAMACRDAKGLVAYSVDTCDPGSEAPMTRSTAEHLGVELRFVRVDRDMHLKLWPEATAVLEHPAFHPSHGEALALCRAARADGVTVVLTGEGSDELFGGYDFMERTWRRWRNLEQPWRWWLHGGPHRAERGMALAPFAYLIARHSPEVHLRFAAMMTPEEETRAWRLMDRFAPLRSKADRACLAHGVDSLPRHLGRILTRHDRIGMAASLEARVPFLSTAMGDLGLHLPRRAKLRRKTGKWAVRQVALRWLPKKVALGRKRGFPVPDTHHAGLTDFLRGGAVADLFGWSSRATDELVPRIERDVAFRQHILSLDIWLRLFFRGQKPEEISERLKAVDRGPKARASA